MAVQKSIRLDFDPSKVGEIATFTDTQLRNLNSQSQRLRQDLVYVICPQWVHVEKLATPVNGYDTSNRIFALGVNEQGVPVAGVTLSVNGLRATHYGVIKDNPGMKIEAAPNTQGLMRAVGGSQTRVFSLGALPIKTTADKRAYITRPFAFRIAGNNECYAVSFTETAKGSGKWNIDTVNVGGTDYVKFRPQRYNDYQEVDNVPVVSFDFVPDKFKKDLPA